MVKVRLQTSTVPSLLDMRNVRPGHYFAGSGPAVTSAILENSVVFAANSVLKNKYLSLTGKSESALSTGELAMFGAAAGVFSATAITPAETIKVRLQASARDEFKGGLDCLKRTVKFEGIQALFRGLPAQLARDVPFNLVFFASYERIVSGMQSINGQESKKEMSGWDFALAGGLAGAMGWTVTLPMDLVKSRAQALRMEKSSVSPLRLTVTLARGIYSENGVRGFFRGWTAAVARSFPVNGALFMTYEIMNKNLSI